MKKILQHIRRENEKDRWDLNNLLEFYRYAALTLISLFYLIGFQEIAIQIKILILGALFFEAYGFSRLYKEATHRRKRKKLLLIGDVILLGLMLYVTGGMSSPFLGYVISPLLLASALAPGYFSWLLLLLFTLWFYLLNTGTPWLETGNHFTWFEGAYFIAVLILVTLGGQLYHHLIQKLSHHSRKMERYFQNLNNLYESVEVFSHHSDPQEIINLFVSCAKRLTGGEKSILWVNVPNRKNPGKSYYYSVRGAKNVLKEENWYPYIIQSMERSWKIHKYEIQELDPINDARGKLLMVRVQSKSYFYGIFSVFFLEGKISEEHIQTMLFLSKLCAEALDKYQLEMIASDIMLAEEKDRIASEIHDHVTQNLFGLVYGLDQLIREKDLDPQYHDRLKLMQKTAQRSIKDLRKTIYTISSKKSNTEPFLVESENYLKDLSRLNNVSINFDCDRDIGHLKARTKNALYRLLREATGNAIRHSECSEIQVTLQKEEEGLRLSIRDDGKGFQYPLPTRQKDFGLGILNMQEIVRNLQGSLEINSILNEGTEILCSVPLRKSEAAESRGEK